MPGRDGSGPIGRGSLTGRGLGPCSGTNVRRFGGGRGLGLGLRRGYGRNFAVDQADTDVETKKAALQEQKDLLKSRIKVIDRQLERL